MLCLGEGREGKEGKGGQRGPEGDGEEEKARRRWMEVGGEKSRDSNRRNGKKKNPSFTTHERGGDDRAKS